MLAVVQDANLVVYHRVLMTGVLGMNYYIVGSFQMLELPEEHILVEE